MGRHNKKLVAWKSTRLVARTSVAHGTPPTPPAPVAPGPPSAGPIEDPTLKKQILDYQETTLLSRALADTRFKLLAVVPAASAVAVGLIGKDGSIDRGVEFVIGCVGFLATLGIVRYDLRNSTLYNATIHRAKRLEELLGLPQTSAAASAGGVYNERTQSKGTLLGLSLKHDLALALIYGASLAGWCFLGLDAFAAFVDHLLTGWRWAWWGTLTNPVFVISGHYTLAVPPALALAWLFYNRINALDNPFHTPQPILRLDTADGGKGSAGRLTLSAAQRNPASHSPGKAEFLLERQTDDEITAYWMRRDEAEALLNEPSVKTWSQKVKAWWQKVKVFLGERSVKAWSEGECLLSRATLEERLKDPIKPSERKRQDQGTHWTLDVGELKEKPILVVAIGDENRKKPRQLPQPYFWWLEGATTAGSGDAGATDRPADVATRP